MKHYQKLLNRSRDSPKGLSLRMHGQRKINIVPTNDNYFVRILEILDYLTIEFPEGLSEYKYVASREADIIFVSLKNHQTQISISKDFLDRNESYDIEAKLVSFQLAGVIRKKRPPHIELTDSELKINTR